MTDYAHHFRPAPDYLILQRDMVAERVGRIYLTQTFREASSRHVTVAKVVAVSHLQSELEWIEYMKDEIRKEGYVGFASHVAAECPMMHQFELPDDVKICMIHVRDVIQVMYDFDKLLDRFKQHQIDNEPSLIQGV